MDCQTAPARDPRAETGLVTGGKTARSIVLLTLTGRVQKTHFWSGRKTIIGGHISLRQFDFTLCDL